MFSHFGRRCLTIVPRFRYSGLPYPRLGASDALQFGTERKPLEIVLTALAFALTCDPFGDRGFLPENGIIDCHPLRSVTLDEPEVRKPRQMPTDGGGLHAEQGGQPADRNVGIVQQQPHPFGDLSEAAPPPRVLTEVCVRNCYHTVLRPLGR